MIKFEHVSYTYGATQIPALHDVNLEITEGEFVLVAGASGSGKSTLLRCINGLVPHFHGGTWRGHVEVAGRDTRDYEPRTLSDIVGFVFQDPEAQMVVDIVEDELVFGMENLRLDQRVMRRRVEEVLDQLAIAHLRRRRLPTLSGGERQRVAIAAVLTMMPRILVLDEPTSQLDPHGAEEVLTALQKLNADLGLTIVLSEHRLERVVQYVDRIVFCNALSGDAPSVINGRPEEILQTAPFAPPLVQVARALDWKPLPLTIKDGRRFVAKMALPTPQPRPAPIAEPSRRWLPQKSTAPTPLLAVEHLRVVLDSYEIIQDITFAAAAGEIVAVMGRNGSGKTTVLRTIMGLVKSLHGRILVDGQDIQRLSPEERGLLIGYVPQDPRTLLFQPTVRRELEWTLQQMPGHSEASATERADRIARVLAQLGLSHRAESHPRDISTGEQQRVALATALIRDPHILLLDEPTRGLDYINKERLMEALRSLRAEGQAIVLVTHDVELVAACADRVVLLGAGEVVTEGPTRTLLHESLIFSSQIGKLFAGYGWLTAEEAIDSITGEATESML